MTNDRYRGLSEEEKAKIEYARNRYWNMSEEVKQKLRKQKNQIYGMSQKELQQGIEQLIEHTEKLLKGLKSEEGDPLQKKKIFLKAKSKQANKSTQ